MKKEAHPTSLRRPACGIATSLPVKMLTFPSQVPAFTIFTPKKSPVQFPLPLPRFHQSTNQRKYLQRPTPTTKAQSKTPARTHHWHDQELNSSISLLRSFRSLLLKLFRVNFTPPSHPVPHSALPTSHSRNPHGTAVFCAVPQNQFFSRVYFCATLSHLPIPSSCFPSVQFVLAPPSSRPYNCPRKDDSRLQGF